MIDSKTIITKMGLNAGITIHFYKDGNLVRSEFVECYKFESNSGSFKTEDCDYITVKLSNEYDSDWENSAEESSSSEEEGEDTVQ